MHAIASRGQALFGLGVLMSAWAAFAAVPPADAAPKPNVVFILADDWGWGDLGCYGHKRIQTPHLDRLAQQGIRFTQYYVNGSVCSPTRAALLTSRFPAELGLHGHLATPPQNQARAMPNWLDPQLPTVARLLQRAGYATGHFGKWHLGGGPNRPEPSAYGFDQWRIAEGPEWNLWGKELRPQSTALIVDETLRFIEQHQGGPFYVQAWLLDTHATLYPTDAQMAPYKSLLEPQVPFRSAGQIYYAAATDADHHIGRLLKRLDELGLTDNTIVIFSSDNGPEDMEIRNAAHSGVGSAGPFRGRKRSLYEGGVRVPFILRWPAAAPAGRVDNQTVMSGVDLLPTLCRLAGVAWPDGSQFRGEDMADAWRGQSQARTHPLLWEWRFRIFGHGLHHSPMLSIREGHWKLLLNPDRSRTELYDLPADPSELNNLADRQPAVVERLAAHALAWQQTLPPGPRDKDAGTKDYPWPK